MNITSFSQNNVSIFPTRTYDLLSQHGLLIQPVVHEFSSVKQSSNPIGK